uniref:non-homologous end-joining DNA ligase LigD n=1 Tax=Fodinicola feengrottensis TaxID=435914 RepID=UPI0036F44530
MRGRERPTVSTPLTWDEVEAAEPVMFEPVEVLDRVEEYGDLLADLTNAGPRVPA